MSSNISINSDVAILVLWAVLQHSSWMSVDVQKKSLNECVHMRVNIPVFSRILDYTKHERPGYQYLCIYVIITVSDHLPAGLSSFLTISVNTYQQRAIQKPGSGV